jgi:hypothetical protein
MGPLPTRRLLDATARLTPADRALLNLWLNRGLDEQRLSQLTGMRPEVVVTRRARLIERLSEELTLPPDDVLAALAELAVGPVEPGNGNGALEAPGMPAGLLLGPAAALAPGSSAPQPAGLLLGPGALAMTVPSPPQPAGLLLGPGAVVTAVSAPPAGPPRRRLVAISGGLAALALAVILLLTLTGGSGAQHRATGRAKGIAAKPAPAPTPAPTTPTTSTPVAPAQTGTGTGPVPEDFAELPGGLMHVRGSVQLVGSLRHLRHLRLKLRVTHLPIPHRGHYEVWLFNSVLDSTPLGRLRQGRRTATYKLPPHARRYRWIDISFQPLGYVNHSGESVLRASNPAHTTKARLRKRSARRRHQLRRAASRSSRARTSK